MIYKLKMDNKPQYIDIYIKLWIMMKNNTENLLKEELLRFGEHIDMINKKM